MWDSGVNSMEHLKAQTKTEKRFDETRHLEEKYRHEFYHAIKPLLIGLNISGKLPCRMTKENKYECVIRSFSFVYCIVSFGFLSFCMLEQFYESVTILLRMKFEFKLAIEHGCILSIIILLYFPIPLCMFEERKTIPDIINAWPLLLVQMKLTTGHTFSPRVGTLVKIFTILDPIATGIFVFAERNLIIRGKLYRFPAYIILFAQYHYSAFLWVASFLELNSLSKHLEKEIIQTGTLKPLSANTAPRLEELRLLWYKMSTLVQETGDAVASSICFFTINLIVIFIVSWFVVMSSFIHPEYDKAFDFLCAGLATGSLIFLLSEPAHQIADGVGGKIMRALSCIDLNQLSPQAIQEVHSFWLTINNNYPHITLAGRTTLNRRWLSSMGANVLTYLIVLVQFQAASLSSSFKAEHNKSEVTTAIPT